MRPISKSSKSKLGTRWGTSLHLRTPQGVQGGQGDPKNFGGRKLFQSDERNLDIEQTARRACPIASKAFRARRVAIE